MTALGCRDCNAERQTQASVPLPAPSLMETASSVSEASYKAADSKGRMQAAARQADNNLKTLLTQIQGLHAV